MTAPRPELPRTELPSPELSGVELSGPELSGVAQLDAGMLDEARAREVRAAAESDPAARAMLGALAATRAELAALPDPPVPPALARRWSAALQAEQTRLSTGASSAATDGPTTDGPAAARVDASATASRAAHRLGDPTSPLPPTPAPRTPAVDVPPSRHPPARNPPGGRRPSSGRRALLRRPAVLAAALLVAVLVCGGLLNARHEQLPTVDRPQLVAQGLSTVGVRDTGGLDDPARRAACLRTVAAPGTAPTAPLLGGRRVVFEGKPGLLLVLGTGRRGSFDIVIVDPACGTFGGTLLAATHVAPP